MRLFGSILYTIHTVKSTQVFSFIKTNVRYFVWIRSLFCQLLSMYQRLHLIRVSIATINCIINVQINILNIHFSNWGKHLHTYTNRMCNLHILHVSGKRYKNFAILKWFTIETIFIKGRNKSGRIDRLHSNIYNDRHDDSHSLQNNSGREWLQQYLGNKLDRR